MTGASCGTASPTVASEQRLRISPIGALVRVRGDQHDGALEIRVHDRRRGDQEVAGEGVHALSLHYAANVLA